MENWKASIYFLAAGQGLLLSLALLSQLRKQNKSNFFLGLILFILSLEVLNGWVIQTQYQLSPHKIPFWLLQSYLILPPSIYFFAQFNLIQNFRLKKFHWVYYLPAFIEILAEITMTVRLRLTGHFIRLLDFWIWGLATEIFPIFWTLGVMVIYGRQLLYFTKTYTSTQVKSKTFQFRKQWTFFVFFLLLTILWLVSTVVPSNIFIWIELILTIFLFALGYLGYLKPNFFEVPALPVKTPGFEQYQDQKELQKLNLLFTDQKIYLQPKLSLKALADQLELPSRYVSFLINTYHHQNFHAFVNSHRVEEVLTKIKDPKEKHKTLLALALESGFSSKSSFNQVFKEQTGLSPSHYQQKTS